MADLTVPELHAQYPRISEHRIRYACRTGKIRGARLAGRVWLIPTESAAEWAAKYAPYGALRGSRGGRQTRN